MCTADRGNPNKIIMLRNARDITDVKIWEWIATGLDWPHVFLATWALSLAIRSALENCLPMGYSCCGKPEYLIAGLSKWVISCTRHFTSIVPLFVESYRFDVRLYSKTYTRWIFRPKLYINGLSLSHYTISWHCSFKWVAVLNEDIFRLNLVPGSWTYGRGAAKISTRLWAMRIRIAPRTAKTLPSLSTGNSVSTSDA
jgi:hypothetical protein